MNETLTENIAIEPAKIDCPECKNTLAVRLVCETCNGYGKVIIYPTPDDQTYNYPYSD